MKLKMHKKLFLPLGLVGAVFVPIALATSCSTSWTRWNENDNQANPVQDPSKTNVQSDPIPSNQIDNSGTPKYDVYLKASQYKTGDLSTLQKALVQTSDGYQIQLDLLQNQFQVNLLIIEALKLKTTNTPLDEMWRSSKWGEFKDFINQITDKTNISLTYKGEETPKIAWDFASVKPVMTDPLDATPKTHLVDIEDNEAAYIGPDGVLTSEGSSRVARAGVSMIQLDVVISLISVDANYAFNKLSLLTNLPSKSFDGSKTMLGKIGDVAHAIWEVSDEGKFTQPVVQSWAADNNVVPGLLINSLIKLSAFKQAAVQPNGITDAALLLQVASDQYKEIK